jgi:hypothetical protein
MFEKTYQRKPHVTKAIQFDGSDEHAEILAGEFLYLFYDGGRLYFTGEGGEDEVYEFDWVFIQGNRAVEAVDRDVFADNYEEVK